MKRPDHFPSRNTQQDDRPVIDLAGPVEVIVTPDLVARVEAAFPSDFQPSMITNMDFAVANMTGQARRIGQLDVIRYLQSLIKQEGEHA